MDAEVAQILKDKNILVWEEMLRSVDYPDMGVVEELRGGTGLVGAVGKTGLWSTKFQPALVALDELHDIAKRDRAGLQQQFNCAGGADLIVPVWDKTKEEVASGISFRPSFEPEVRHSAGSKGEVH